MTTKFINELILWLDNTWWTIKEVTDEIPERCNRQKTTKEVSWDHEYVYQKGYGRVPDSWVGDILIPMPDSEKYLHIKFEC